MAFDYSRLTEITGVTCAGTTHTMYTNPSSTTSYVRQILIHASDITGFSGSTVKMFVCPAIGGDVGYAHATDQFFLRSITTNETYLLDLGVPGLILKNANDTLMMVHTSLTTLNYYVMGGIEV